MSDWRDPIHPGEVLVDELEEIGMRPVELAARQIIPYHSPQSSTAHL